MFLELVRKHAKIKYEIEKYYIRDISATTCLTCFSVTHFAMLGRQRCPTVTDPDRGGSNRVYLSHTLPSYQNAADGLDADNTVSDA